MSLNQKSKPKDILYLPSGSIGDGLMMVALSAEILKQQPDARVTFIARRNGALMRDLAAAYPGIRVVVIEKNVRGALVLAWEAFCRPYIALMPAAFGLRSMWNTERFFKLLSRRPGTTTIGLLKSTQDADPYQKSLVYDWQLPHIDNLRRLARLGGLVVEAEGSPVSIKLHTSAPEELSRTPYIVFHPFGSSSWKSWPPRRSKELLHWLRQRYPNYELLITAAEENEPDAREITHGIHNVRLLVDRPMLEVAGVIEHAALYIGVDTGITHIAGVLNAPSVVLGHLGSPSWLPRYNPQARILYNSEHCHCGPSRKEHQEITEDGKLYIRCLYDITDDSIHAAVESFLKS